MTKPDSPSQQDHNVASPGDTIETVLTDAVLTGTALMDTVMQTRMRFQDLEDSENKELAQMTRPLKCLTLPGDMASTSGQDPDDSPKVLQHPDVVQCLYGADEDVSVETELTTVRARFANWDAQPAARKDRGREDEESCLPPAYTISNLKAKFEAITKGTVRREAASSTPQTNRRAKFSRTQATDVCSICDMRLYLMERMEVSGFIMHRNCFRCSHCSCHLRLVNYTVSDGNMYCGYHYRQLFMVKGNYDEGFGRERNEKWLTQKRCAALEEGSGEQHDGEQGHVDKTVDK